jgi:hypothetical protein
MAAGIMMIAAAAMALAVAAMAAKQTAEAAAAAAAAAMTAAAAVTSQRRVVGAQQGNADHREEDRDAENQCSIHLGSSFFRYPNVSDTTINSCRHS